MNTYHIIWEEEKMSDMEKFIMIFGDAEFTEEEIKKYFGIQ